MLLDFQVSKNIDEKEKKDVLIAAHDKAVEGCMKGGASVACKTPAKPVRVQKKLLVSNQAMEEEKKN